jgi:putative transposase
MSAPPSMMNAPRFENYQRRLPHWRLSGSVYFVTFRLLAGKLTEPEIVVVRDHICSGHLSYYTLLAVVVMPDHVHALLKPSSDISLSRIMKGIKGVSAKKLNQMRGAAGSLWQDESWDRIVRDEAELQEKLEYMLNNPLKAGLVEDGWAYLGWHLQRDAFGEADFSR